MQHPLAHGFGKVVQVSHLVEDVDLAMERWIRLMGVGPWTCIRNIQIDSTFDGQPLQLRLHEANSYIGDLQIQLVQPLNPPEVNTPYSEFRRAGRLGVHHIAFMSKDSVADAARAKAQGFTRQIEMREPQGFRHYYCQSPAMPELWIEFLQSNPGLNEFFASGIADTARWDGKSAPVRNVEAGPPQ